MFADPNTRTFIREGPADGSASPSTSVTFTFNGQVSFGPNAYKWWYQYDCKLDGAAWQACDVAAGTACYDKNTTSCYGTITYTGLASGQHTFSVRTISRNGGPSGGYVDDTPETVTWTVGNPPSKQMVNRAEIACQCWT